MNDKKPFSGRFECDGDSAQGRRTARIVRKRENSGARLKIMQPTKVITSPKNSLLKRNDIQYSFLRHHGVD
ncbi:MAG: hypothetical protein J6Q17_01380 [Clostridia bacterium]|nr:hypothetical protein [Clostridia bacterium]